MRLLLRRLAFLCAAVLFSFPQNICADPLVSTKVEDVPLADGAVQRVLVLRPETASGAIVMLPGGAGEIGISSAGNIMHGDNFTVRTKSLWAERGYVVLIPDAIEHHSLRGLRHTPFYAGVVAQLVALAHRETNGPVFLVGTSQGSIAAMNGAAHAEQMINGVVLTESVSRLGGSEETVFDAEPGAVKVPALVVANQKDECPVSPPEDAERIASAMKASPSVRVLHVDGGEAGEKDCGSLSPHGYYGMEAEVVSAIADWMRSVEH